MTTATIMDRLRHLGVILETRDDNLIVDAPFGVLTSTDLDSIRAHKAELLAAVTASSKPPPSSAAAVLANDQNAKAADGWPPELCDLIGWFHSNRALLPDEPFHLGPGQEVIDTALFYSALDRDILVGPRGARAKLGGLSADLTRLQDITERLGAK
jgi:TubC N-terminal docking domain